MMDRRAFVVSTGVVFLTALLAVEAQQMGKVYRVGVVLEGEPYYAATDGLRAGRKELGFEEGKQYILQIRDVKGDRSAVAEAAKTLELEKIDLIYAPATASSCGSRWARS